MNKDPEGLGENTDPGGNCGGISIIGFGMGMGVGFGEVELVVALDMIEIALWGELVGEIDVM